MTDKETVKETVKKTVKEEKEKERVSYEYYGSYPAANGGSYMIVICPFCKTKTKAYLWSMAGKGKRCDGCNAIHSWYGFSDREKRDDR